ncbi:MAG: bifunctional diaminohydroxyphosphoribosylaminopyrimidine deaminase/5-amino-6-(5-phosphoribosylamino)uracil reductase RibD [Roseinatronobacter sp.]
MRHAIALGARGLGQVWPNPAVGCVIVRDRRILARGWTQPGGRPHAEAMALAQCDARGATAYVSLEPCAHQGRAGPCAAAVITAGVARVVTALTDPDPRVAGRGHAILREAGVEVVEGIASTEARRVHEGFLHRVLNGRPMVTLKLGLTLDGKIATASGESRWITGPDARRAVHALRARHDAVLVGAGTLRADDPDLQVRDMGVVRQPVRVVALPRLDIATDARLFAGLPEAPLWLVHAASVTPDAALAARGVALVPCPSGPEGLDPQAMLAALGARGLTRVLCEGGGQLAASLLRAELVDRIVVFQAGAVIGAEGRAGIGGLGLDALAEAPRFVLEQVQPVGADVMQVWGRRELV